MADLERIRLWVEALRSGKFEQGRGTLKATVDGANVYCCLGVACEVAIANGLDLAVTQTDVGDEVEWKFGLLEERGLLPLEVRQWLGLLRRSPLLTTPGGGVVTATDANDSRRWTFPEIADAIERTYLEGDVNAE